MAIVDDIKCPRCDRKYSGVRSRCPYCGARRIGLGKYSKDSDNARGKMLISVLILSVFTVAAGIMLFSTPSEPKEAPTPETPIEDDTLSLASFETPTPSPTPIPTIEPPKTVEAVAVMFGGGPLIQGWDGNGEFTHKLSSGTLTGLHVVIEPPGLDVEPLIESLNEDIFYVEPVYGGSYANSFSVTPIAKGTGYIQITVDDVVVKVTARIT